MDVINISEWILCPACGGKTRDKIRTDTVLINYPFEDYLQMVSAEQKEYAEVFDYGKITEKNGIITDYWTNNFWI